MHLSTLTKFLYILLTVRNVTASTAVIFNMEFELEQRFWNTLLYYYFFNVDRTGFCFLGKSVVASDSVQMYKHTLPTIHKCTMPTLYQRTMPKLYKRTMPTLYKRTMPTLYKRTMHIFCVMVSPNFEIKSIFVLTFPQVKHEVAFAFLRI